MKIMEYKGFKAQIMKAVRLVGEHTYSLPPGTPIDIFPVDSFNEPLSNWLKGAGNYVVPVQPDWGLWFNWCDNDDLNTSVLLSIKGMNPVTGQRTNGFALEKYEEKCPVHDTLFKDGLFCEQCGYRWPEQNYIAFPNTLWWDGFRTADGSVRQFFFTEDIAKSIPELVIGKEDTVPAFGFAFYRPKVARQHPQTLSRTISSSSEIKYGNFNFDINNNFEWKSNSKLVNSVTPNSFIFCSDKVDFSSSPIQGVSVFSCSSLVSKRCFRSVKENVNTESYNKPIKTEVGVGAGAKINQKLIVDPLKVSDWEDKPASVMRLYFIFLDQFKEIQAKGMKDLTGCANGYLEGLPVG